MLSPLWVFAQVSLSRFSHSWLGGAGQVCWLCWFCSLKQGLLPNEQVGEPPPPHAKVISLYFFYFYFKIFLNCSWPTMFCQFLLCSKVTQSYIHISISISTHSFNHIIFHCPSMTSDYSSLCYTAGPHCLSTPNASLPSTNPKLPIHTTSSPLPTEVISMKYRILKNTN